MRLLKTLMQTSICATVFTVLSVAFTPSTAQTSSKGACPTNLSFLNARLPQFNEAALQNLREQAIQINVLEVMKQAKAQGVSANQAVDQMLTSAKQMDASVSVAGACAADFDALGASDEAFFDGLRNGQLAKISNCQGIRNACICAGLSARLGAVVTRVTAAAMQCHAKAGNW